MENEELIAAELFCSHHQVEISFIRKLNDSGLLQLTTIQQETFVPATELQKLEQLTRLHYELNINLEGLEAITHLLDRLESLQVEVNTLKNRLRRLDS